MGSKIDTLSRENKHLKEINTELQFMVEKLQAENKSLKMDVKLLKATHG